METPDIWVRVSPELLAQLGQWSEPVQAMIVERGPENHYDMIFRAYQPDQKESE